MQSYHAYRRRVKCIQATAVQVFFSTRHADLQERIIEHRDRLQRMARRNFEAGRRRKADREAV